MRWPRRSLGSELGLRAQALHWHFDDWGALCAAVVDHFAGEHRQVPRPGHLGNRPHLPLVEQRRSAGQQVRRVVLEQRLARIGNDLPRRRVV